MDGPALQAGEAIVSQVVLLRSGEAHVVGRTARWHSGLQKRVLWLFRASASRVSEQLCAGREPRERLLTTIHSETTRDCRTTRSVRRRMHPESGRSAAGYGRKGSADRDGRESEKMRALTSSLSVQMPAAHAAARSRRWSLGSASLHVRCGARS